MGYSAIFQALGGFGSAMATGMESEVLRAQYSYNEKVYRQKAELTRQAMELETERAAKKARRIGARQRAAYSASGAVTTVGTPLTVLVEQAGTMQRDILQQRRNRMLEIAALKTEAERMRAMKKFARRTGVVGAFAKGFGGAGAAMSYLGSRKSPESQQPQPSNQVTFDTARIGGWQA